MEQLSDNYSALSETMSEAASETLSERVKETLYMNEGALYIESCRQLYYPHRVACAVESLPTSRDCDGRPACGSFRNRNSA